MNKVTNACDVSGQELGKGDTVATLSGDLTAKICDLCEEGGTHFIRLRPLHQPYGRGVWHPADQTQRLSKAPPKPNGDKKTNPAKIAIRRPNTRRARAKAG